MQDEPKPIGDQNWIVPTFEVQEFSGKEHNAVLVIPVLNEGERIQLQLKELQALGHPIDTIIADGGSTDGSLEKGFLMNVGVRACLTKTGPGKLSAQLRMAYAWALRQGYTHILTVDGNGKDGMDAIPRFLEKLTDGYDYVQGSRYHPDGRHENTPLERAFANKYIHAPLLSRAGKASYSDTTNGFRGYSSKFLLHKDVQPFRDVFDAYELLFYLTVRAGQLGLRLTEVAVTRTYPPQGQTPTKINGISGKLRVLKQTIRAAMGAYHPR